jgi:hypothetical protein
MDQVGSQTSHPVPAPSDTSRFAALFAALFCAAAGVYVMARHAPLGRAQMILFAAGYFTLFEYGLIARGGAGRFSCSPSAARSPSSRCTPRPMPCTPGGITLRARHRS